MGLFKKPQRHRQAFFSRSREIVLILTLLVFTACSKIGGFQTVASTEVGSGSQINDPDQADPGVTPTPMPTASPTPRPSPTPTPAPVDEALAWESTSHPERAQWSTAVKQFVASSFATLDKAQDIKQFCPAYATLTQQQKINAWADLFAATAYYESAWDPTANSVDVGTAGDKNTWSVGLLQMSVDDQQNYGFNFGFTFADLQTASDNLQLAVAVMAKQVTNHGVILIPSGQSGVYWATLHPGGAYDKSASIETMVKKLSFCP